MSGLQDFLTPFSHLIFANRDKVIVLLAALLAWFTIQLLVTRWRNERLERDLAASREAPSASGGRRYATNTPAEEPPAENGALPPVKGGRTYARNLGTALQKAGISGPQIYSPPSPPGWAPNTNPTQTGMGQPGPGAPYAPQNVPWAAPAGPPPAPWGYPAGAGRGMPAPGPNAAPFYQPQPGQPQQQPSLPQPPGGPGFYGPPPGSPFAQPSFPAMTSGPGAPAPNFAPPGPPIAPILTPAFGGNPPAAQPPAAEPPGGDAGRRGKPKRRRFNFNVLENLEKMVQPKTAEPAPPTGWTPPVSAAPSAPAPPVTSAPFVAPKPEAIPSQQPGEATPLIRDAPLQAESLPLRFGPEVEAEPETVEAETKPVEAEGQPVDADAQPVEAEAQPVEAEAPGESGSELGKATAIENESEAPAAAESEAHVTEAEPEPAPVPESRPDARGSMRSMLFGEEAAPQNEAEPAAEAAPSEPQPVAADQPVNENEPDAEATTQTSVSDPWRPWIPEAEVGTTLKSDEGPAAEVPETPPVDAGDRPSAGTIVIIEDDQTAASYYATLFRGNGYQVEVANDGVSGVDVCTRMQPQLILLDVMMPRQNGILVLQTLRASDETKNTPVVVMSNFSEPTLIKRAIQLGALEYVIKTQVEGPALLNALPRWINHEKAFAAA
jgi:CheY-like chemotaxis protein